MAAPQDIPRPPLRERLRGSFRYTGKALGLVWKASPAGTVALVGLTVLSAALYPASAYAGKLIVDAVVAARGAEAGLAPVPRSVLAALGAIAWIALPGPALGLARL